MPLPICWQFEAPAATAAAASTAAVAGTATIPGIEGDPFPVKPAVSAPTPAVADPVADNGALGQYGVWRQSAALVAQEPGVVEPVAEVASVLDSVLLP